MRSAPTTAVTRADRAWRQVAVMLKARLPAMDGSQCSTQPFFETPDAEPLRFTMGDEMFSICLAYAIPCTWFLNRTCCGALPRISEKMMAELVILSSHSA